MAQGSATFPDIATLVRDLDRAVAEVFGTMIGMECVAAEPPESGGQGHAISVLIGLAGALRGSFLLRNGGAGAQRICAAMTGQDPMGIDSTVRDAIGEVANMVAGAWKSYEPEFSSRCAISTPMVIAGDQYEMFSRNAPIRIERSYRFREYYCAVSIACERTS